MSTSSPTRSTSSTTSATVVLALGSNLGDRGWNLRRAVYALRSAVNIVRVSAIHESAAVDAPQGSPPFLNLVLIGTTPLSPNSLLTEILAIETRLGRVRRGIRNEPRLIDIDLILHGTTRMGTRALTLPHPRAFEREFVMGPLRELGEIGEMLASGLAREPPLTLTLSPPR
ncbi:MAG: 2-amino-4-hydroxy-6-hydroxymethyldihydropteridine diphosphokinase [Acidobacteriota bacterium]|nr:2-amino-4-hydroxy-6-hydroxymethyldihydropteridine diphosphokinase [Acidobacteriota bacterium]